MFIWIHFQQFRYVSPCFPWNSWSSSSNFRTNRQPPFQQVLFGPRIAWRRTSGALRGGSRRMFSEQSEGPKGEPPKAGYVKLDDSCWGFQGYRWNDNVLKRCLYNHFFFWLRVFKHLKIFGEFGKAHLEWLMGLQTYTGTKQALNAQIEVL